MRKRRWTVAVLLIVLIMSSSDAFSQGLSGWFDLVHSSSTEKEDGRSVSDRDVFNRNLYLNFQKAITPMLNYQINLRSNFSDSDATDLNNVTTTTYSRSLEPALDLIFQSPVYEMTLGYRIQEQWDEAGIFKSDFIPQLRDEGRTTTEFQYMRLNVSPRAFPSLNLQYDSQENYDHGAVREVDDTSTTYSIGSSYQLPSRDVRLRYTINFSRLTNKTPLSISSDKTVNDNFNNSYNIGYNGRFWSRKVDYSVNYQGNYSRSKSEQFVLVQGQPISNQRDPRGGFYAQGTTPPDDDVDVLLSQGDLIDDDLDTPTSIGLSVPVTADNLYQNIGILVSSQRSVSRLYIYVNQNITADTLVDATKWTVYRSNFNQANTWTQIPITSVTASVFDVTNSIYRYEIEFSSAQAASFFKAINQEHSSVTNVLVTEIEAYGDDVPTGDTITNVTTTFTQGLNLNGVVKPVTGVTFSLHYSLDRTDQNPISVSRSVGGLVENLFSDSIGGEADNFQSTISRNYGAAATWLIHRLLSSTARFQRNESFDNRDETDVSSDSYHLSFNSAPLPTLDATFSIIQNDSFSFDEKNATSNSLLLTVGSKLHRDVNMITDMGYTKSEALDTDTSISSKQLTGSLDAVFTPRVSGNLNYGFTWSSSSGGESSNSKEASAVLTYRPGKFVNINGNITLTDSNGDVTTSEGLLIDWLPLRAIRLNMNYQHTNTDVGNITTDAIGGYVIWYVWKFADIRLTHNYISQRGDTDTEAYNISTNLNCRF